jgi:hypothetical protein
VKEFTLDCELDTSRGRGVKSWLFVRRDVERIFQYRQSRLKDLVRAQVDPRPPPGEKRR